MRDAQRATAVLVGGLGVALAVSMSPTVGTPGFASSTLGLASAGESTGRPWRPAGDRGWIAFTKWFQCLDMENVECDGGTGLYVVDAAGGRARRVASVWKWLTRATLSPDGRRLAFTGTYQDDAHVDVVDVAGSHLTQLAEGAAPAWSPDGRRIAFERDGISVMNADGSDIRRLAEGRYPAWSPDGRRIAFNSGDGISVMNADGSDLKHLAEGTGPAWYPPAWSPDGRRIAFEGDGISVMKADGSHLRRLTDFGSGYGPRWSPNGRRIAFSHVYRKLRSTELYVMHEDGSHVKRLTSLSDSDVDRWFWSPNGRRIVFSHHSFTQSNVGVVNSDGGHVREVARARPQIWIQLSGWFGAAPTRTTLNARPASVTKRARLSLTGHVTKTGIPFPAARVRIRFKPTGAHRFTMVTTCTTGPAGRYRATVTARKSGTWQAVHPATRVTLASRAKDKITLRR